MRKSYLIYKLGVAVLFAAAFQSCKKENGIDNDTVIKKPYGLYIGTDQGALLNTNDGMNYKTIFPPDGFKSRALVTSGMNILWAKGNLHMSADNGRNFNPTYFDINNFYLQVQPYFPWQPIILSANDQNRVYVSSRVGRGIAISDDNGKTWKNEDQFDDGIANTLFTSFTQLSNGAIFAHNLSNDSLYKKDNKGDKWSYKPAQDALPATGAFVLGHNTNKLLAMDVTGQSGVYFSDDEGLKWQAYTGLPANRLLYAIAAPFDAVTLVGTDSMGVYRLENGNFVPSNNGLDDWTVVYAIVGKEDVYKNETNKRYIYIATNKGLYRSEDMGMNWQLVKEGSYVALY